MHLRPPEQHVSEPSEANQDIRLMGKSFHRLTLGGVYYVSVPQAPNHTQYKRNNNQEMGTEPSRLAKPHTRSSNIKVGRLAELPKSTTHNKPLNYRAILVLKSRVRYGWSEGFTCCRPAGVSLMNHRTLSTPIS